MSFSWVSFFDGGKLGESLGLLGKPVEIENMNKKFGEDTSYIAIQIEHHDEFDESTEGGYEEVLLFTKHDIEQARERAQKNPEDIAKFLSDNKWRDMLD